LSASRPFPTFLRAGASWLDDDLSESPAENTWQAHHRAEGRHAALISTGVSIPTQWVEATPW
jgi:hypothetical protein